MRTASRSYHLLYAAALAISVIAWLPPLRAPLWLDETVSFFLLRGGLQGILARPYWPDSSIYSCLLLLWTHLAGTSELALRLSSLLAMIAASGALFLAARELFDWDIAVIAVVIFDLHPIVTFGALDVRPYALAILAVNLSIWLLARSRTNSSYALSALFGFSAACVLQLQLLFGAVLPALGCAFLLLRWKDRATFWRHAGAALAAFTLAALPLLPKVNYLLSTRASHVFAPAPAFMDLVHMFESLKMVAILAAILLAAGMARRLELRPRADGWTLALCALLGLLPALLLFVLSRATSVHVFVGRYLMSAVPGIALCWALILSQVKAPALRALFCASLAAVLGVSYLRAPPGHSQSWKYALDAAGKRATSDHATVVICSDLPESDFVPMPAGEAILDSGLLAPLSYYPLDMPVVALPRALNDEAMRVGARLIDTAVARRGAFVALANKPSRPTLDWLALRAAKEYQVQRIGTFEDIEVREFTPR